MKSPYTASTRRDSINKWRFYVTIKNPLSTHEMSMFDQIPKGMYKETHANSI
jgi:hypothetical protein